MSNKKLILSFLIIGTLGLYFIYLQFDNSVRLAAISTSNFQSNSLINDVDNSSLSTPKKISSDIKYTITDNHSDTNNIKTNHNIIRRSSRKVSMMNMGQYKDGVYVGKKEDAYYGYIKVAAIIKRGRLINVQFLDHPQNRSTSRRVNDYAMPYLRAEAIQTQNSKVDIISGATFSSGAFRKSLAYALTQAKI